MSDTVRIDVPIITDKDGMIGRECPHCEEYFKVKPGTGLPTHNCICPYCEYSGPSNEFYTKAQLEYVKSIAVKKLVEPILNDFHQSMKRLEQKTRNSLVTFKVEGRGFDFPIKYYTEDDLETTVICDSCGLVFSIYGLFASCPDCGRLTSMSMFKKSLEVARKRLGILSKIPETENDLRSALLSDIVSAVVSTFDSLGKKIQVDHPRLLPEKPRNLFQNLDTLSRILKSSASIEISELMQPGEYAKVYFMFQVRHLWIHNFGEADMDFIQKTHSDLSIKGKKVIPTKEQVNEFINLIEQFGISIRDGLDKCSA